MRLLIAAAGGVTVTVILGLFLGAVPTLPRRSRRRRPGRLAAWLAQVGSPLTPLRFLAASAALGAAAWAVLALVVGEWFTPIFPAAATGASLAWTYERRRRDRLARVADSWPDAIRHLLSYIRSGATVSTAVGSLATEGPPALRDVFDGWAERARLLGFVPAVEMIRGQLADPTSDRVLEVLVIAHEWGGDLVPAVLSDLADEITEDLRTARAIHAEGTTQRIESWVVAVVPWLLLVYLSVTETLYRDYYGSGQGRFVVLVAGLWWLAGLTVLCAVSRDDPEPRVLGAGGPG